MLASARDYYRLQQQIAVRAVLAARKAAKRGPEAVAAAIVAYQLAAARAGAASVPAMLAEQGVQDPATGAVATTALAGITSAGFPLADYLAAVGDNIAGLSLAVATQIQDAGRNGASVAIAARNEVGYVRMLNPPSCSRCAVLAGAWYKWNAGFERHPKCDCRHIAAREVDSYDLTTSPDRYFHSLPTAEELAAQHPDMTVAQLRKAGLYSQEMVFGVDGAKAIRDGADVGQVVNARRGMRKAQLYGHDTLITLEGTTRRGLYGSSEGAQVGGYSTEKIGQYGYIKNQTRRRAKRARIMPETIYDIAGDDRAEAQRLLRLYGFIL